MKQMQLTLSKVVVSMVAIIVSWWVLVLSGFPEIFYKISDFIDVNRLAEVIFIFFLFFIYNKNLKISLKEMFTKINLKVLILTLFFSAVYLFLSSAICHGKFCTLEISGNLIDRITLLFYLGLFEEMAFRGWGYTAFYSVYNDNSKIKLFKKFEFEKSELKALVMTNIFFALIHMQAYMMIYKYTTAFQYISSLISVFIVGAYFTIVFAKTKSIWNVIILHAFWDWFIGIMVF